MKYKPGDTVIKNTGGNKMTISLVLENNRYMCFWITEKLHENIFEEDEILTIEEYKKILILEERDDKIKKLFKE